VKGCDSLKKAIITGASSGIGEQFAYQLAQSGYHCVLVARREDRLAHIVQLIQSRGGSAEYRVADLISSEDVDQMVSFIEGEEIDLLVNNAGFGSYGFFADQNPAREIDMMQLNMITVYRLTRAIMPQLIHRNSGGIIQVASLAGFQPTPLMSAYAATKAFVLHYSEAISMELSGTRVHVMALCPGGTQTEFGSRAQLSGKIQRLFTMQPDRVVEQALRGYKRRKHIVVTGPLNLGMSFLYRVLPRRWLTYAMTRVFK
jgi:short-subunit dehydrogenase